MQKLIGGSEGILPPPPRSVLMPYTVAKCKSLMANSRMMSVYIAILCRLISRLSEDESMVSFDIKSLFTNVPVDETLEVVHKGLMEDDTLMDRTVLPPQNVTHLLEMCLRTTYFQGSYYEQMDGAANGVPSIYMEMLEELALRTATHPSRIWKRYVDDTFCVIPKTEVE